MDREIGAEIEAALLRAHREAERSIETARRQALARERQAYGRARRSLAERERELSARADEVDTRLELVERAFGRLGEAMAGVAERVAEIGAGEWPAPPPWPQSPRRGVSLTYSESRSLSLRLDAAEERQRSSTLGHFGRSAPVTVAARARERQSDVQPQPEAPGAPRAA